MQPDVEAAVNGGEDLLKQPTFRFVRYSVHSVLFEEVPPFLPQGEPKDRPRSLPAELQISATATIRDDRTEGAVRLNVEITPDLKWQPYRVRVSVSGFFAAEHSTREQFSQFCHMNAPVILFPYVRELAHRITADAMFGAIKLDPINLGEIFRTSNWDAQPIQPVTDGASAPNDSTEPPPPSSQ